MAKDALNISGMHDGASASLFAFAAELRKKMTVEELLLWEYFKTKPLGFKIRRQHPINRYILDFYCHRARLCIEIDGSSHSSSEQKSKDRLRSLYLESVGIREIRFWNSQVTKNLDRVKTKILHELFLGTT